MKSPSRHVLLALVAGFALIAAVATPALGFGFLTEFGVLGSGDGQFDSAQDVTTNASGRIVYVADSGNNRIQKFDAAGNFLRKWGSEGSGDGQFSNPTGVATNAGC